MATEGGAQPRGHPLDLLSIRKVILWHEGGAQHIGSHCDLPALERC